MKKIISLVLALAFTCIGLASCGSTADASSVDTTYISMRINPEIEMVADEDGVVVYANAVNDDGEVVLSSIELEGMTVEEAGVAFTDASVELGYVDPNSDATVYVDVHGVSDEESASIEETLTKDIRHYFDNNGINGKVSKETLDKYAANAQQWGLSVGHTKLVMRVLDANPELTEEEVLQMTVSQWMELLNGNKGNNSALKELKAEYRNTVSSIKEDYARLFELRTEIETLREQLADPELTEEESNNILTQIADKEADAKTLRNEYKSALSSAKQEYKKEFKELKQAQKAEKNNNKK